MSIKGLVSYYDDISLYSPPDYDRLAHSLWMLQWYRHLGWGYYGWKGWRVL